MAATSRGEPPSARRPPHNRWRALVVSLKGFGDAFRTQQAFRVELGLMVLAWAGAAVRGFGPVQWMLLVALSGLVLAVELLNTALEVKCDDQYGPADNPVVARIKDMGSAAVMVVSLAAMTVYALCLIWPQ